MEEKRAVKFYLNIIYGTNSSEHLEILGEEKEKGVRSEIREETNLSRKNKYIIIPDNGWEQKNVEGGDKWKWEGEEMRIIFSLLWKLTLRKVSHEPEDETAWKERE